MSDESLGRFDVAGNTPGNTRTFLWCTPRSCSTALTKCLSGVAGLQVWFEPYCFCNWAHNEWKRRHGMPLPAEYEGNEMVYNKLADMFSSCRPGRYNPESLSFASIKTRLENSVSERIFVKDIAHSVGSDRYAFIPRGFRHTFLIRHPLRVFQSERKSMITHLRQQGLLDVERDDDFDLETDVPVMTPGLIFKDIYDMWKFVSANFDADPIIIDGDELLANPAELLPKYCRAVGIPYDNSLLRWDSSSAVAKTWVTPIAPNDDVRKSLVKFYDRALSSDRFLPPNKMPLIEHVTPDVIRCTDKVIDFYTEMHNARLRI